MEVHTSIEFKKKKKLNGFQVLMGILEYKNMIDVRGYIVKRNSSLMIFKYFLFFLHSGWSLWWVWTEAILRTKPCGIPLGIRPESQGKTMSWCLLIRCHCLGIENGKTYWFSVHQHLMKTFSSIAWWGFQSKHNKIWIFEWVLFVFCIILITSIEWGRQWSNTISFLAFY